MKNERKLYALVISCILVSVIVGAVVGTRTITDSSDSIYTQIVTSAGGVYAASFAGLQAAINSLNSTHHQGGWINYPGGFLHTTGPIKIWDNVSLDMHWAEVVPTGDFNTFELHNQTLLQNVFINQSANTAFSNTSACIYPYGYIGDGDNTYYGEGFDYPKRRLVRDVTMIGQKTGVNKQKGIGIYIHPTIATDDNGLDMYENIKAKFLNCAIKILIDVSGTYANGNLFNNILGVGCAYFIWLRQTVPPGGADTIAFNKFTNIFYEAEGILNEHYPIFLEGNCDGNMFDGHIMDWIAQGDTTALIFVNDSRCDQNIFNIVTGFNTETTAAYIIDNGDRSVFYTDFYLKQTDINTTTLNQYDKDTAGVKFYSGTTGNPYTYFYGYDTGSSSVKSGLLRVESTGRFWISSDTGEDIKIAPAQGGNTNNVTIDDILKMDGRTTHPHGATEGMIYYNTTTHLLMLYTTAWHSINIT